MGKVRRPTEGGNGGKKGHSNMSHWELTEIIKKDSNKRRREGEKEELREEAENYSSRKDMDAT